MDVSSALGWMLGSTSPVSGAIDVVAVRQEDDSFTCSPFHVKLPVRAKSKRHMTVTLKVNGESVKVSMRLGSAGEAFFIIKNDEEEVAQEFITCAPPSKHDGFIESDVKKTVESDRDALSPSVL